MAVEAVAAAAAATTTTVEVPGYVLRWGKPHELDLLAILSTEAFTPRGPWFAPRAKSGLPAHVSGCAVLCPRQAAAGTGAPVPPPPAHTPRQPSRERRWGGGRTAAMPAACGAGRLRRLQRQSYCQQAQLRRRRSAGGRGLGGGGP